MAEKRYDSEQLAAINATGGHFLVLAPPGCGKTDILAERVVRAREQGIEFEDMLCLTFTNRASRSMRARVLEQVGEDARGLFVGNIHRFCSTFLYRNHLIAENTSIIDDDDQADIMQYFDDHHFVGRNGQVDRSKVKEVSDLEEYLVQRQFNQPAEVLKGRKQQRVGDVFYCRFEEYYNKAVEVDFRLERIEECEQWKHLRYAIMYHDYKQERAVVDFSDLLVLAYEHLRKGVFKTFPWIQIDEVQDLNDLQLAIVDSLTNWENPTVMYLGDEQQAIYSFLGAKLHCLDMLRNRCEGKVLTLGHNYRSPKHLLDVFNTYAEQVLGVSHHLLPHPAYEVDHSPKDLILARCASVQAERERVYRMIDYYSRFEGERLAVLVHTNMEADMISAQLDARNVPHFKISGTDMFRSKSYKTFAALFSVLVNEFNFLAWVRLLHGIGAVQRLIDARDLVANLKELMMTPSDLLTPEPYLSQFCRVFEKEEVVLFDTETTGLDVFNDDIVQIAAFKIREGKKVEGSDFNIIIHTEREIPAMLGSIPNPLVEEYSHREHLSHQQGLRLFLDYIGDCPVVGHNVLFDYQILQHNVIRYLEEEIVLETYDSLRIIKSVKPHLKRYKLEYLLEELGLEGTNSHLANEDIDATFSLLRYCYSKAKPILPKIDKFLSKAKTKHLVSRMQPIAGIMESIQTILPMPVSELKHDLADVMMGVYKALSAQGIMENLEPKFGIFLKFVRSEWEYEEMDGSLRDLIANHLIDMTSSLNEGDLINSLEPDQQRIFVMTVHKGKGLEFDNVIVLGAVDGTYPNFRVGKTLRNPSSSDEDRRQAREDEKEDARKLYVALTRTKKRLCVSYSLLSDYGYDSNISPFIEPIRHYFIEG